MDSESDMSAKFNVSMTRHLAPDTWPAGSVNRLHYPASPLVLGNEFFSGALGPENPHGYRRAMLTGMRDGRTDGKTGREREKGR